MSRSRSRRQRMSSKQKNDSAKAALDDITHRAGILRKQVELLREANTNLEKRDSIDRVIVKASRLEMDQDMITKAIGISGADLVKFRDGFETVALKALSM